MRRVPLRRWLGFWLIFPIKRVATWIRFDGFSCFSDPHRRWNLDGFIADVAATLVNSRAFGGLKFISYLAAPLLFPWQSLLGSTGQMPGFFPSQQTNFIASTKTYQDYGSVKFTSKQAVCYGNPGK